MGLGITLNFNSPEDQKRGIYLAFYTGGNKALGHSRFTNYNEYKFYFQHRLNNHSYDHHYEHHLDCLLNLELTDLA